MKTIRSVLGERNRVQLITGESSIVQQSAKEECDINNILKKYKKTGLLTHVMLKNPQYGDFSSVSSYQDSVELVRKAEEQFSMLSAKVRDRFGNDPVKFLEFVNDSRNVEEMVAMGLATEVKKEAVKASKEVLEGVKESVSKEKVDKSKE